MEWQTVKLGDVCSIEKEQFREGSLPYVGMEDIEGFTGRFLGDYSPRTVASSTFKFSGEHVLYGRLRPYLNKVLVPDFEGHCSSEIFPLKPTQQLERKFLYYWLSSEATVNAIDKTCTGARMPRANVNEVLTFDFLLPPILEQKRLVAILDEAFADIEQARAKTEQNLKNARELFESYLQQAFSQRGEGWVEDKLANCFKLRSGDGLTAKNMIEGPYPVYGGNGIAGMHNNFNLSEESIIIGRVGALCGNARHITEEIWLTDNAFKITQFQYEFDYVFLTYLLNFKNLRSLARQAAQPVISNSSLSGLLLAFPSSLSEQKKIALEITKLEEQVISLESIYSDKLNYLDELKQSILQKAFSGELTQGASKEEVA